MKDGSIIVATTCEFGKVATSVGSVFPIQLAFEVTHTGGKSVWKELVAEKRRENVNHTLSRSIQMVAAIVCLEYQMLFHLEVPGTSFWLVLIEDLRKNTLEPAKNVNKTMCAPPSFHQALNVVRFCMSTRVFW